ncbi:MAG: DNRLRE domain-containing protein, partial [Anaerolineae bacterium]
MRTGIASKRSGAHRAWYAGLALLLAMLLISAAGIGPAVQATEEPAENQDGQAPLAAETEAIVPATEDEMPVLDGPTDAVLAAELEPKVLEEIVLPNAIQTIVEIPVGQDTYIASNKPSQNFGQASELRVGWDGTSSQDGALRAFLYFDVARYIPSQAVINSAVLKGYQFRHEDDSNMLFRGRHLLDSWDENLVTWNSHQPNWGSVTGETWIPPVIGWIEHDLTPLVKEWLFGTHPNYGLFVQGDETPSAARQRFFYSINAQNSLYPRLVVDYTVSTDTTAPVATVAPLPVWSPSSFTVSWSGTDTGGSGLAYYDVQYNANGGEWTDWKRQVTSTSATFEGGLNGVNYQFRARAVDHAGNVQVWGVAQAQTTVDAIPPTAAVQSLPANTYTQSFHVFWNGSDNVGGSGLASFDVEYRIDQGAWLMWLSGTTLTSAQFTGGEHDALYEFRARARDQAGNVQPFDPTPQAST